jgi:hypothetical protein
MSDRGPLASEETHPPWNPRKALGIQLNAAEIFILAISSVIAVAIFLLSNPVSFGTDSNTYLLYAFAISQFTVNPGVHMRQAGYPWLIVATLYPWTLSLLGVLAIQAACAAAIPLLIYKILRFISAPLALCGALFSIATLLPYNFQTFLFPDHMQVFFSILFCYFVVRFVFESSVGNMAGIFITYICISFFRPPFLLFYLLIAFVVGIAVWKNRKNWSYYMKPFFLLTILAVGAHASASALDSYLYAQRHQERGRMHGKLLFLNPFINSVGVDGAFQDGRKTAILRQKLVEFFRNAPPEMKDIRKLRPQIADRFMPYQSDPEKMAEAVLNSRDNDTWWILYAFADGYLGKEGDPLFMRVALEQYRLHPKILWNVISNGFAYYLGIRACEGPPAALPGEFKCWFYPSIVPSDQSEYGFPHHGPFTGMRAHTLRLVDPAVLNKLIAPFTYYANEIWPSIYRATLPLGSFLTVVALLFVSYRVFSGRGLQELRSDLMVLFCVLSVYFLYSGPMVILTDPEYRYVSAGALFLVMSGMISLRILIAGTARGHRHGS